eukprot:CAMPEP_0179130836 /NCGR_PEP_ID=MMETSP0796-20121207/62129_1 /TAXON_ID=73915 /ORGANISM="Pyrodinium bahamense, Strain pbaha01" /LENGTH=36 /DNA_ID= /DNA_START= /DNA_END= /DNA_ORIENTATION=
MAVRHNCRPRAVADGLHWDGASTSNSPPLPCAAQRQ